MKFTLTAGLLAVLCADALPSFAQPLDPNAASQFNWNQTTGLVNIPIARSLPRGAFYGAFDFKAKHFQDLFGSEFLAGGGDKGNGSFHLMFSPIKNVEIGIMGLHDVNRDGNVNTLSRFLRVPPAQSFSTAIKWVVAEETQDMPSIAVGVENLTYPYPKSNGRDEAIPYKGIREKGFYAVASKSFPVGDQLLSLHLGAGAGRFNNRPFGGLEYTFDNGFAFLGEYDGNQATYGMRYTGLRNFRITAAMQGGQPTFQLGFILNPFDLIGEGDQKDYDPFARPGLDNSTEGFRKPLPAEPETELEPPMAFSPESKDYSGQSVPARTAPARPSSAAELPPLANASPYLAPSISPESSPRVNEVRSVAPPYTTFASLEDDEFSLSLANVKKSRTISLRKSSPHKKASRRAAVVRPVLDEESEFGIPETRHDSRSEPIDDFRLGLPQKGL